MTDVMISYSRKDVEFVKQIHQALIKQNRDIWVDWEDIPKTADWWNEIKDGIEKADNFIYVISPDSVSSEVCGWEINHAIDLKKRLIPVLHREVTEPEHKARMHAALSSHNWVFAREKDDLQAALQQISTAIDTDLDYIRNHTRLLVRALEWEKQARDKSFLLVGSDLKMARDWLANSHDKKPVPDKLHIQYIKESNRVTVARRRTLIASIVFTAIIVSLAGFAGWQAVRAENARQSAVAAQQEAQSLAVASESLVVFQNDNIDQAIALALQAATNGPARPEIERALSTVAYAPGTRLYLETGHPLTSAVLSPTGRTLLIGAETGLIYLYDLRDPNAQPRELQGHSAGINTLSLSENGTKLLSTSKDGTLRLWTLNADTAPQVFEASDPAIRAALSPDGAVAISSGSNEGVSLWTLATGEAQPLAGHTGRVWSMAFSPDGQYVATGDTDGMIRVWNVAGGTLAYQLNMQDVRLADEANCFVFSPDSSSLYFCGKAPQDLFYVIYEWPLASITFRRSTTRATAHSEPITSLAISRDGKNLLTGSQDNHAFVWNSTTLLPTNALHGQHTTVAAVGFDASGKSMMTATRDGAVRIWDTEHGAQIYQFQRNDLSIWNIAFSPDNHYVIASSSLDLIDVTSGEILRTFETDSPATAVQFNSAGDLVAIGLTNGDILVYEIATGREVQRLKGHTGEIWEVVFTKDGKRMLSASEDQTARVWDSTTWKELGQYSHDSSVWSLTLSPDDSFFITGTEEGVISVWDFKKTSPVRVFERETSYFLSILDLDISPDGKSLVSGESDNQVRVWDVATGRLTSTLQAHHGKVSGVAYSLNGQYIITGGYDTQVLVWDTATGKLARTFVGHSTAVSDVSISSDGKIVASGTLTGDLRLWHVHTFEELVAWTYENRFVPTLSCSANPDHAAHQSGCS